MHCSLMMNARVRVLLKGESARAAKKKAY